MILLRDKYYRLLASDIAHGVGTFKISIIDTCDVFNGHFPGHPICPGVFNVQTLKECCADVLSMDITIISIKQCRFLSVIEPTSGPLPQKTYSVKVNTMAAEEGMYSLKATIEDDTQIYLNFDGKVAEKV